MTHPFPQQPPMPPQHGQPVQPPVPQGYPQPAQPVKPRSAQAKTNYAIAGALAVVAMVVGIGLGGNEGDVARLIAFALAGVSAYFWHTSKRFEKEEQAAQPPMPYSYPQGYVQPAQFAAQPPQYPYPMMQPMQPQGYVYPPQSVPANPQQTVQPPAADRTEK